MRSDRCRALKKIGSPSIATLDFLLMAGDAPGGELLVGGAGNNERKDCCHRRRVLLARSLQFPFMATATMAGRSYRALTGWRWVMGRRVVTARPGRGIRVLRRRVSAPWVQDRGDGRLRRLQRQGRLCTPSRSCTATTTSTPWGGTATTTWMMVAGGAAPRRDWMMHALRATFFSL